MTPLSPPVFCDNCPLLALAEFEGAVLCTKCLLAEIESRRDPGLIDQVKPLRFARSLSAGDSVEPEADLK